MLMRCRAECAIAACSVAILQSSGRRLKVSVICTAGCLQVLLPGDGQFKSMQAQLCSCLTRLRAPANSHLAPSSHVQSRVCSQQLASNQAWRCHSCWCGAKVTMIKPTGSKCSRLRLAALAGHQPRRAWVMQKPLSGHLGI